MLQLSPCDQTRAPRPPSPNRDPRLRTTSLPNVLVWGGYTSKRSVEYLLVAGWATPRGATVGCVWNMPPRCGRGVVRRQDPGHDTIFQVI